MMMKKIIMTFVAMAILLSGCVDDADNTSPVPTVTPIQTINDEEQKVIDLAKQDLATVLSVPIENIKLSKIEAVTWPDSSLGYRSPDKQYLEVMTPGYKIFLTYNNVIYEYHSSSERVVSRPTENKSP